MGSNPSIATKGKAVKRIIFDEDFGIKIFCPFVFFRVGVLCLVAYFALATIKALWP